MFHIFWSRASERPVWPHFTKANFPVVNFYYCALSSHICHSMGKSSFCIGQLHYVHLHMHFFPTMIFKSLNIIINKKIVKFWIVLLGGLHNGLLSLIASYFTFESSRLDENPNSMNSVDSWWLSFVHSTRGLRVPKFSQVYSSHTCPMDCRQKYSSCVASSSIFCVSQK